MKMAIEHFRVNRPGASTKFQSRACSQPLAWLNQRLPSLLRRGYAITVQTTNQQALGRAAAGEPLAKQACGENTCVVDYEQIAASEDCGEIGELPVGSRSRTSIEHQQSGCTTLGGWLLCDE